MSRTLGLTMSVHEMGILLGLKKTESYWLLKKNYFQTVLINNKLRINRESFDTWYKSQTHYKKITGEKPGAELDRTSYSISDIAKMLNISRSSVYSLISYHNLATIMINKQKRVPKKEFYEWYCSQTYYHNPSILFND